MELNTKRLILKACTIDILESLIKNNGDIICSENWPEDDVKEALPFFLDLLKSEKTSLGWGMWLIVLKEKNIVIGGVGFVANPDNNGFVELGYGIDSYYRRKGYTFEACTVIKEWAFSFSCVNTIIAKCEKENVPSIKLLEKLGMESCVKDDLIEWRLNKQ